MELIEFVKDMDFAHRRAVVVRIADACTVSYTTATRWITTGMVNKPLYKKAINEEFRKEIFKL